MISLVLDFALAFSDSKANRLAGRASRAAGLNHEES
jgi:hypothetical protein